MADFETRNLIKKTRGTVKMVMTEECLDDWEAQTLNIPFEKLVRHKKTLRNVFPTFSPVFFLAGGDRASEKSSEKTHLDLAFNDQINPGG